MADNNDKSPIDPALPSESSAEPLKLRPPAAAEPAKPTTTTPPNSSGIGWLLVLIVLMAALGGAGYWFWQQWQSREAAIDRQLQNNQSELGELRSQLQEEFDAQVDALVRSANEREQALQQQLRQLQQTQNELQQQLQGQQQRLNSLSTTSREDWLLAEAEYLLNVANQRVLMERSPENALALLRAADDRLLQVSQGSGDATVFSIRKTLNEEIAALESVEPVDKEGIYLRLYALAETVDTLPRLAPTGFGTEVEQINEEPVADSEPENWAGKLWREIKNIAGSLDRYVRIDDVTTPTKPLVDTYSAQLAALNVRLLLEQAQLAVLQEEPRVYLHSLEQAQKLLQQYYVDSEANRRLQNALQELTHINVAPSLPEITESKTQLRNYLRQLHRVRPAAEGQL